jgi:hypothetical protein
MLDLFKENGKFKKPAMAYRTHGSEFLIYESDFGKFKWEDLYANRLCILNVRPTKNIHQDLQNLLDETYPSHILVGVLV